MSSGTGSLGHRLEWRMACQPWILEVLVNRRQATHSHIKNCKQYVPYLGINVSWSETLAGNQGYYQ